LNQVSYGKRGVTLENMIEYTNNIYRTKGWGLIDKVPTPWNVHYDKRTGRVIKAFPKKKGIVDFMGVSHGRSIAFDAKSTNERSRFPLRNIEQHQMDYLAEHQDQGGISFFIVGFAKLDEYYYLSIEQALDWWKKMNQGGRKSIPYNWFLFNCDLIHSENGVPLDYLKHCGTVH